MPTKPTTAKPVLRDGVVYAGWDRYMCSSPRCAGSSALFTGVTIDGHRVRPVTEADKREWAACGLGALTCECGAVTA